MMMIFVPGSADVSRANRLKRVIPADRAINDGWTEHSNQWLSGQWSLRHGCRTPRQRPVSFHYC